MRIRPKMVVAVVVAMAVSSATTVYATHVFNDVTDDNVHSEAISWAADNGITLGCDQKGNFCPEDPLSRAQMVEYLYRLFGAGPEAEPIVNAATLGGLTAEQLRSQSGPAGPPGSPGVDGVDGAPGPVGPAGPAGDQSSAFVYVDPDDSVIADLAPFRVRLICHSDVSLSVEISVQIPETSFHHVSVSSGSVLVSGAPVNALDRVVDGPFEVFGQSASGAMFRVEGYAHTGSCQGAATLKVEPPTP